MTLKTITHSSENSDPRTSNLMVELRGLIPKQEPAPVLGLAFLERVFPLFQSSLCIRNFVETYFQPDVNVSRLSATLASNPMYSEFLLDLVRVRAPLSQDLGVERSLILLGMQNSRDALVALSLWRKTQLQARSGKWPDVRDWNAREQLKYALLAEESATGKKDVTLSFVYQAGSVFDLLRMLNPALSAHPNKTSLFLEDLFRHGLKTAQVAYELQSILPLFPQRRALFAAALLHDVGKAVMAVLNPGYLSFEEEMRSREFPRILRYLLEFERFGITHDVMGAMLVHAHSGLRELGPAIRHHHFPFAEKRTRAGNMTLAQAVALATNMARDLREPKFEEDPIYDLWLGDELKQLEISRESLKKVAKRLV